MGDPGDREIGTFRIRLRLESALSGPLQGDSLFGLVCTGMALREGEDAIAEFLASVDSGERVLVLSNGFPEDCLPMPLLEPRTAKFLEAMDYEASAKDMPVEPEASASNKALLVKTSPARPEGRAKKSEKSPKARPSGSRLEAYIETKRLSGLSYIPASLLLSPRSPIGIESIRTAMTGRPSDPGWIRTDSLHAAVDRISGRSLEEGGLFSLGEYWREPGKGGACPKIDLYAVTTESIEDTRLLIERTLEGGYGAKTSSGRGRLSIDGIEKIEFPEKGSRLLALGNFIPGSGDLLRDLRADVMTKFGKTGPDMALGGNPFKKPILMYREGANFLASEGEGPGARRFAGCLLSGIHSDARIRHHAFAPLIPYEEAETP